MNTIVILLSWERLRMIKKIKKSRIKILLFLFIFSVFFLIYTLFYDINNISGGKFLNEVSSSNGDYALKAYLIDGGPLSSDSMRVELVYNKNKSKVKNIYFNYPENSVTMKWLDNFNVEINGKQLNINKETYDWRKK